MTSTILVCDTDEATFLLIDEVLSAEGYYVQFIAPNRICANTLVAIAPHMLIFELVPFRIKETIQLLREIRHLLSPEVLSIVLTTTDPQWAEHVDFVLKELGCMALSKPFDIDNLVYLVRQRLCMREFVRAYVM
jgi:DNA-binding response OmpR family regulator